MRSRDIILSGDTATFYTRFNQTLASSMTQIVKEPRLRAAFSTYLWRRATIAITSVEITLKNEENSSARVISTIETPVQEIVHMLKSRRSLAYIAGRVQLRVNITINLLALDENVSSCEFLDEVYAVKTTTTHKNQTNVTHVRVCNH